MSVHIYHHDVEYPDAVIENHLRYDAYQRQATSNRQAMNLHELMEVLA